MTDRDETAEQAAMRDAYAGGVGILLAGKRLAPTDFYRDVVEEAERVKRAAHLFRNDTRFSRLVDSTVAEAFAQHGRIDHESPERDAHEVATRTAALLLARIYEQDAELKTMREERDAARALAENVFAHSPSPITWPKIR